MASIRKRGENSYLLVVSRGYDYQGNRLKPAQKTVHPPKGLTAKQTEKWLNEQAVLYEREVKRTPGEPVNRSITLAKYIDIWLEQVAPKKLAASTLVRDKQDIRRILPALGHYKLAELNKDILRAFYDAMRSEQNWKTGGLLAEKTVEGIHSCLCGILSDAVEAGYCALPGFVDSKNEEKTERNAGYLVVSHSGGGMLRQGTRKGIRRTPANRGMRAHRIVKSLDISEDVCHGMCP